MPRTSVDVCCDVFDMVTFVEMCVVVVHADVGARVQSLESFGGQGLCGRSVGLLCRHVLAGIDQ